MLNQLIDDYLKVNRAMGYDLEDSERLLRKYPEFAAARGETHIRAQTAIEWAAAGSTANQRYYRLRRIVLLARYARAEDPGHEIPPGNGFPKVPRQFLPIIYTQEEARRLIAGPAAWGHPGASGLTPSAPSCRCCLRRGCGSPRPWRFASTTSRPRAS